MNTFDRYLALNFLKIFLTVTLVAVILIVMYSVTNLFIVIGVKDVGLLFDYVTHLIPLGFYILSPLTLNISLIILFKRLIARNVDLTAQSFGISPLRLVSVLILFTLGLSLSFVALNERFIPSLFKGVWKVERERKGKEREARLVHNLWLLKETRRGKNFIYIGSLDVSTGVFTNLYMSVVSKRGVFTEVVEGRAGVWSGHEIKVREGSAYNFEEGYYVRDLKNFSLGTEINLKEVSLFAEKIMHVRMSSLLELYAKGSKIGLDTSRYMTEILHRIGMSFMSILVMIPLIRGTLKHRNLKITMVSFVIHTIVVWFVTSSPKLFAERANLSPHYAMIPYSLYLLYILKGVHDLRKGFRL